MFTERVQNENECRASPAVPLPREDIKRRAAVRRMMDGRVGAQDINMFG